MKSEPPSVKSERPPSVKSERPPSGNPRTISLPGTSVGSSSIKSESEAVGMVGSYYGSRRGSLGSRTSYGGSTSASVANSGGASGSSRTTYGGGTSVGSNQTPRSTSASSAKSAQSRSNQSGSMSNVTSLSSSRPVSVDADNVRSNSYRPFPVSERPRRDEVLRAGRTFEVPEKKPGYVAETRARRRV